MNRRNGFPTIFLFVIVLFAGCKSFNYRVANNYYEQYAYSKAIPKYESVLRKDFIPDAAASLADCYSKTGNSLKAEIWYKRLVKTPNVKVDYKLYLAEVLMENGKYDEAKIWFQDYLLLNSTDKRVKRMIIACDSIHKFFEDTTTYEIQLSSLNKDNESNFAPVYYKQGLVFLSDRPALGKYKEQSTWTGKEYLDLFYTQQLDNTTWREPELLKGDINGLYDEGPAAFSPDFNTIYFTRTDYTGKIVEKNQRDIAVLKLYYGKLENNNWRMMSVMPFNNPDYSVGHPAVSRDGKTLYFVSDMPWGYGGTDIYKVNWQNNQWSDPVNLGSAVNSEGNEMFPFIAADSVLYFASDGHIGLGGLDIFASSWNGLSWSKPENLQHPVNSSKDDFSFIIDSTNNSGYFSSNRTKNTDKIYQFIRHAPVFTSYIYSRDKKSSKQLKTFTVYSENGNGVMDKLTTATTGKAELNVNANTNYNLIVKSPGYYAGQVTVSTMGKRKSANFIDSLALEKIELNKQIPFRKLQFVKKETEINQKMMPALDSLVVFLQRNPELQIEIASHTDSRGSFTDNLAISRKRSDEIAFYLINKGINAPRLISIGYGEGKLLNYCRDGILCLEEDHAVNNRVEIRVIDLIQ